MASKSNNSFSRRRVEQQRQQQAQQCDCCPFGCHIDVDFVQFAAEAAQIPNGFGVDHELERLRQRSLRRTKILDDERKRARREQYYKHLLANESCQSPENNSTPNSYNATNSAAPFTDSAMDSYYPASSPSISSDRNDNSSALFLSDSLENIMSDFDDAYVKSGGASSIVGAQMTHSSCNENFSAAPRNDLDNSFTNNNHNQHVKMPAATFSSRDFEVVNQISNINNDAAASPSPIGYLPNNNNQSERDSESAASNYQTSADRYDVIRSGSNVHSHAAGLMNSFSVPASPNLHNLNRRAMARLLPSEAEYLLGHEEEELVRHLNFVDSRMDADVNADWSNKQKKKNYYDLDDDVNQAGGALTFPKHKKSKSPNSIGRNLTNQNQAFSKRPVDFSMDFYDSNKNYYYPENNSGGGTSSNSDGRCGGDGITQIIAANIENVASTLNRMKLPPSADDKTMMKHENDSLKTLREQTAALERIQELENRLKSSSALKPTSLLSQKQKLSSELDELKKQQQLFTAAANNNNFVNNNFAVVNKENVINNNRNLSQRMVVDEMDFNTRQQQQQEQRSSFKDNLKLYEHLSRQQQQQQGHVTSTTNKKKEESTDYRTALGRAMSALGHSSTNSMASTKWQQHQEPETPRRTKSFERMKELFGRDQQQQPIASSPRKQSSTNQNSSMTSSSFYAATNQKLPGYHNQSHVMSPHHVMPPNLINKNATAAAVSVLGGGFHSLNRAANPNSRRYSNDECVSDSELALGDRHLPVFSSLRRSRILLRGGGSEIDADQSIPLKYSYLDSAPNRQEKLLPNNDDGYSAWLVNLKSNLHENNGRKLNDSEGICKHCEIRKSKIYKSAASYTGPLPEPKPCYECENLRRKLLMANFKPVTFNVASSMEKCMCEICVSLARKTFTSTACGTTTAEEFQSHVGVLANLPTKSETCERCSELRKRCYISFGVNTDRPNVKSSDTNTTCLEVASRKINTDHVTLKDKSVKTDDKDLKNSWTSIDKRILLKYGYLTEKASATENPAQYSVGFNTDLTFDLKSNKVNNIREAGEEKYDVFFKTANQQHAQHSNDENVGFEKSPCFKCSNRINHVDKSTFTQEDVIQTPSVKSVGSGTENADYQKDVYVSTKPTLTYDKLIDCSVTTRDHVTSPISANDDANINNNNNNNNNDVIINNNNDVIVNNNDDDVIGDEESSQVIHQADDGDTNLMTSSIEIEVEIINERVENTEPVEVTVEQATPGEEKSKTTESRDQSAESLTSGPLILNSYISTPSDQSKINNGSTTNRKATNGLRLDISSMTDSCTSSLINGGNGKELDEERNMVSSLVVEDDYDEENRRGEEDEQSDDEDLTYYTDDEEFEEASPSEISLTSSLSSKPKEKFDFTKPRATRAFFLSKAAATKKLLTSSPNETSCYSSHFKRNTTQSRSVRLEKENKGDSLAYIADKKRSTTAGTKVNSPVTASTTPVNVLLKSNCGLKDKVLIKKQNGERKNTGGINNGTNSLQAISPIKSASTGKDEPLPPSQHPFRKSLLLDEEREEVGDTLGPLPSEMVKPWSNGGCEIFRGYDNFGANFADFLTSVENPLQTFSPTLLKRPTDRLVGDVIENINNQSKKSTDGAVSDDSDNDSSDDDEDESGDEGSYDTNGNISKMCPTISDDGSNSAAGSTAENGHVTNNIKLIMSEPLKQACDITNRYLLSPADFPANVKPECAQQFLQHEWLKAAARKNASPKYVEEFLDAIEAYSRQLLHKVVNMCDQNENTALHYAVSHCNFDIVSLLLDTKVCNLNRPNKAGYTPVMLAALCQIGNNTDGLVVQRLFQMGDVNIKASQHGQTALMLAVSHGKLETTKMLLDAGAGVNIQDEDGSTALMCAAEHGHKEIVRQLLMHPEIDASMADYDGSTALSIAVENGHKDIGVLIYAHLNYARSPSSIKSQSAPVWC